MPARDFIRFSGVSFGYGGGSGKAIKDVTFAVGRGQFTAVVGTNGSGKSTLVRLMNGLLKPTAGRVTVDGMDTLDAGHIQEIRRRVGIVFQNPDNQLVGATVEEDIAFGPENLGRSPSSIRESVEFAMDMVGLKALAKRPTHTLSGGQKQQLAIAGAVAMSTDCLVLDEPTSMLGPAGRRSVIDLLKKIIKDLKITIVLVTHFMEETVFADRVLVMLGGGIVLDGTPAKVFQSGSKLTEIGLDLPSPAELARRLRMCGVDLPDPVLTVDQLVTCLCRL